MSRSTPDDEWIFTSIREQLIAELARRRLSTDGSDSVLALRLLRRVRTALSNWPEGGPADADGMSDNEHLGLPEGEPPRPDRPYEAAAGPRTRVGFDTPRGSGRS